MISALTKVFLSLFRLSLTIPKKLRKIPFKLNKMQIISRNPHSKKKVNSYLLLTHPLTYNKNCLAPSNTNTPSNWPKISPPSSIRKGISILEFNSLTTTECLSGIVKFIFIQPILSAYAALSAHLVESGFTRIEWEKLLWKERQKLNYTRERVHSQSFMREMWAEATLTER